MLTPPRVHSRRSLHNPLRDTGKWAPLPSRQAPSGPHTQRLGANSLSSLRLHHRSSTRAPSPQTMSPQKSRQLGPARHLAGRGTLLAGAKDTCGEGRGALGGRSPCLMRTGSLRKALTSGVASEMHPRPKNASWAEPLYGSSQRGCPMAGTGRVGCLNRRAVGVQSRGSGASAAPTHQGTLRNGVKCREGSVRCKTADCISCQEKLPKKHRHAKNTWLPGPAHVRKVRS